MILKSFIKWLDSALTKSDGTKGIIKHDYSFYHHALMLYGYWTSNITQFYKVIAAFKGTPYAEGHSAMNIRQNLIVANRMFRGATFPFHLRGRNFGPIDAAENRLFKSLGFMALDNNGKIDLELASTWLNSRMDQKIPLEFQGIEPYNRYHQVLKLGRGIDTLGSWHHRNSYWRQYQYHELGFQVRVEPTVGTIDTVACISIRNHKVLSLAQKIVDILTKDGIGAVCRA